MADRVGGETQQTAIVTGAPARTGSVVANTAYTVSGVFARYGGVVNQMVVDLTPPSTGVVHGHRTGLSFGRR